MPFGLIIICESKVFGDIADTGVSLGMLMGLLSWGVGDGVGVYEWQCVKTGVIYDIDGPVGTLLLL